jgi:16S rRNA (guanine527-N7)-methyltransferase
MLSSMALEHGLRLSGEALRRLDEHARLMLEWNRSVNLTRITDPFEIASKHFLDSLIPARWLPDEGRALDVGTGAGFPGAPLEVLHPGLQMVLLDRHRRKIAFLKVLLSRLGLPNIRAVQGRWEEWRQWGGPEAAGSFRLIVMRAVRLEASHLVGLAAPLLEPGGVFAWWGGPGAGAEAALFERELEGSEIRFLGGFDYSLPGGGGSRRLMAWRREER